MKHRVDYGTALLLPIFRAVTSFCIAKFKAELFALFCPFLILYPPIFSKTVDVVLRTQSILSLNKF